MYVLAFDLSSITVGYSIFNIETKELIEINYIKFPETCQDLLDKGKYLEGYIQTLLDKNPDISEFVIEERLKNFMPGSSSANTILTLAQLNYICQYLIKFVFKLPLTEIHVITARCMMFPEIVTVTRKTKQKQKDFVFEKALVILGHNTFPTKILKSGKNKGDEVYLDEATDMSDSWVIGSAFLKLKHGYVIKTKPETKKKKK